ncbi:MAG TPA: FAD-binding oxidoreductase [Patescibacteria group bacterium]|nr:FAD-binding oxidoreductase [Patescibacteria group bacterium]
MNTESIEKLRSQFRGKILAPGHAAYESARKVYNAMFDRHPRWIAQCADAADVIAAVRFAGGKDFPVSIRGGGHHAAGLGVCDDGLVIDLSSMKHCRVDPKAGTARVAGGCTWGDVDHATHAFGMATPSGFISTTGVGGLTLGGGIGYLSRKYGLTIDNLLEADVVLADGSFVTASRKEHPDLFWALRGGGGNFGVVTSFLFRLHPVDTVFAGPTLWPMEQAAEVMKRYAQFIQDAPEEVNGFFVFMTVPPAPMFPETLHNRKMCGIVWCYCGPVEKGEQALRPMRQFGKPAFEHVGPVPFPALQSIFDALYPPGFQWYWKSDTFKSLDGASIALHMQHGPQLPTPASTMHLYPINGAVHRVKEDETAFSARDSLFSQVIVGVDPDPANKRKITGWARQYWDALHPHASGGAYVNFLMEEGEDRLHATYGANFRRLAAVKAKYDPQNFFHLNQNIRPEA